MTPSGPRVRVRNSTTRTPTPACSSSGLFKSNCSHSSPSSSFLPLYSPPYHRPIGCNHFFPRLLTHAILADVVLFYVPHMSVVGCLCRVTPMRLQHSRNHNRAPSTPHCCTDLTLTRHTVPTAVQPVQCRERVTDA